MSVTITPFLRQVLRADALISGAAGLLMAAGAPYLAPFLGLPSALLFWAGVALFPFVALLVAVSARSEVSRLMLIDIIGINALWVAASFGVLLSGADRSKSARLCLRHCPGADGGAARGTAVRRFSPFRAASA